MMPRAAYAGPTTFIYVNPTAARVALAGEFNAWDRDDFQMRRNSVGVWEYRIDLKPGRYEYRFIVDGAWDKANRENRVILVEDDYTVSGPGSDERAEVPVVTPPIVLPPEKTVTERPVEPVREAHPSSPPPASKPPVSNEADMRTVSTPSRAGEFPVVPKAGKEPSVGYPPEAVTSRKKPVAPAPEPEYAVEPEPEPASAPELPRVPMLFTYTGTALRKVTVAGEFNDWNPDMFPMVKKDADRWEAIVNLAPGTYEYKFIVDGNWDKANRDERVLTVKGHSASRKKTGVSIPVARQLPSSAALRKQEIPPAAKEEKPVVSAGKTTKKAPVVSLFEYVDASAKHIALAGEFNGWDKTATSMEKTDGGRWLASVNLKPGRYEYKFVVDGDWDKANKENRTIDVTAEGAAAAASASAPGVQAPARQTKGKIGVPFRYKDAGARNVGVGGEFNNWNWESNRMTKGSGGAWTTTIDLAPGEYAYKIVVDGDWREDPSNKLTKEIGGQRNSLIRVTEDMAEESDAPSSSSDGLEPGIRVLTDGRVRFVYRDDSADQVFLSGSFNDWIPDAWPMMKRPDGLWVASVKLKAGAYTYKYYIDGVWKADPANPNRREGGYGPDSVLEVSLTPKKPGKVLSYFKVEAKTARRVTLAGTFNQWDPSAVELVRTGNVWETTIPLEQGSYEYKFIEDGDWAALNAENRKIDVK